MILTKILLLWTVATLTVLTRLAMAEESPDAPAVDAAMAVNREWTEEKFSFVYGEKPSSAFLQQWAREVKDEVISDTTSRRTLTFTDPATKLEVAAVCLAYRDTGGVDWTVHFTNKGDTDSPIIEQVKALDAVVTVSTERGVVLHRLNGAPCLPDDWKPFDQPMTNGTPVEFAATNGRSSNVSPWFSAEWGGGGVVTAIGWSGQWSASVRLDGDRLRTQVGMSHLHTVLHPGESLRSPRILQLRWEGGDVDQACNLFRRAMFAHIMPRIRGQVVWPPIAHLSTAFYELNDSNERNVLSHLESLRGLGFEMFWLDAYWTGPSGFPNAMGNYGFPLDRVEPKDRFPHGLRGIAEAVEKEGLGFLMWFEPERVAVGTYIAKEHPEWVISPSGDGGGLYHLGIPAARQYMTDYLNAAIKAYKLACLRIDYNIDPLAFWRFLDARDSNRVGMAEMRYVEGLYQMWDDILKANPNLFIDNCASGGRRIDLETMSRSLPLWRSDNTCDMLDLKPATVLSAARKNQLMSLGLNRYVPFSTVGQMGATPYLFRSGFNAGIAFAEDVRPKDYPRERLKQAVAEGKRIRKYFRGDFYPLVDAGTDPRGWMVMQYHRPEENDGMVMAFRRDQSADPACEGRLRGIDPAKHYEVVICRSYEPEKPLTLKGSALRKLGIEIPERPGSAIVEYRVVAVPEERSRDQVPGVVIDHSLASSGLYIGSPSLAVLTNGDYVASHDFFGPQSGEFQSARSVVFRSSDRGQNWKKVSEIQGAFWSSLFVHRGALYLLGPDRHHGNVLIRRSTDAGETWTSPTDSTTGLLRNDGEYHCAPMPVIEHGGRLWRAFERRQPPVAWGINYRAGMASVPVDADLLNSANWTFSEFLPSDRSWNGGDMGAWLEGNAVVGPNGGLCDLLRVQTKSPNEKAAIVRISDDGKQASFDPNSGFVAFPGGAKKFTIRRDPRSGLYWSLASIVLERHRADNPGGIRNALALTCSSDLRNWTVRCILLYHPDTKNHGFQYVDWLFDGDDIVAACRTAYDDAEGGAHNNHDANFLTFHRFANFRGLAMADSVALPK